MQYKSREEPNLTNEAFLAQMLKIRQHLAASTYLPTYLPLKVVGRQDQSMADPRRGIGHSYLVASQIWLTNGLLGTSLSRMQRQIGNTSECILYLKHLCIYF